jgi:hypothetical protein
MDATQRRNARRQFIRDNHPDRGGDASVFVAGLARFSSISVSTEPPVTFYRRPQGIGRLRPLAVHAFRRMTGAPSARRVR